MSTAPGVQVQHLTTVCVKTRTLWSSFLLNLVPPELLKRSLQCPHGLMAGTVNSLLSSRTDDQLRQFNLDVSV